MWNMSKKIFPVWRNKTIVKQIHNHELHTTWLVQYKDSHYYYMGYNMLSLSNRIKIFRGFSEKKPLTILGRIMTLGKQALSGTNSYIEQKCRPLGGTIKKIRIIIAISSIMALLSRNVLGMVAVVKRSDKNQAMLKLACALKVLSPTTKRRTNELSNSTCGQQVHFCMVQMTAWAKLSVV